MLDCEKNDEISIIAKISSWDIDAYFCIVEKYKEKLLTYILRLTNVTYEEAENLLQEVFIKAYKNINSYDEKYSFSSWIYKMTHNLVIDYYRKNKDKETISLETQDEEYKNLIDLLDNWQDIEKDLVKKELILEIRKILNELDLKYREVLILRYLEEKDYNEISDILRISPWTVASLINRGKKIFAWKINEKNMRF